MTLFTDGSTAIDIVQRAAVPLRGDLSDYNAVADMAGDARFVLLGEASHGTYEFYQSRADITRQLIVERGFSAVAVEADWPDAYRVNRYVRGLGPDRSADEALSGFRRFPQWMWRNTVVREFVEWLRRHNALLPESERVGFYGLDLYNLHASVAAVIGYLNAVDPDAADRARKRYACFDMFSQDPQAYGYATSYGQTESCEDEVVEQLREMQRHSTWSEHGNVIAADAAFGAEQNARLVRNAEEYYRAMFRGRVSCWNLRDSHMVETLNALVDHLDRSGVHSRVAVWAHNSHLGDASGTQMGAQGEWNVGQLVREQRGADALLIGYSTHTGTVTAADDWGGSARTMRIVPSLEDSSERLFHDTGVPRFFLNLRDDDEVRSALREPRPERAIGVIYRPRTERSSHYFAARLSEQFDAIIHLDETSAIEPLEMYAHLPEDELPETYPFSE
jgi:erythromycin esterase-like protein